MITFITHLRAADGQRDALVALLTGVRDATRANEPDVLHYDFAVSVDDPDVIAVIEVYRDAAAQASHMETPWIVEALPRTMPLVAGSIEVRQYVAPGTQPVVSRFSAPRA